MKNFEKFCFRNLLTTNVISSKAWSTIKLLLSIIFMFCLPIRSPRFLFCLYAMIGSSSHAVLRFEFICNKWQSLSVICFTFGNVFFCVITKGILFRSFSFAFRASNASLSIFDSCWNSVSRNLPLKPRFINYLFSTRRFLERSEVSLQIFFMQRACIYGILFISDLGWTKFSPIFWFAINSFQ